jgi:hypothetical protein
MPRLSSRADGSRRPGARFAALFAASTLLALSFSQASYSQTSSPAPAPAAAQQTSQQEPKRLFGLIPNYKSSPPIVSFVPISTKEKFKIATRDSFDRGAIILALAVAGKGQLSNSTPSFGQGMVGYSKYFGAGYCDVVLGDFMTEGIYPWMLRQDPRYFRKGSGGGWSRLGHAVGAIFVTRSDAGEWEFNLSEFGGNATAVLISNAYYPDSRHLGDNFSKLGMQVGIDMAGNILKEFVPDIMRKVFRKPAAGYPAPAQPAPTAPGH